MSEELIPSNLTPASNIQQKSDNGFKSMSDFIVIKEIGDGSFSTVYLAKEKIEPQRNVAIKMCLKKQILKEKRVASVHREKQALARLSEKENLFPLIVCLYATFQDVEHLYFVVSYAKHGDLLQVMLGQPEKKFSLEVSHFLSSQLLVAIQHIHSLGFIHRDLKPENILVTENRYILLSDFGCVKDLNEPSPKMEEPGCRIRRSSYVGTAQYVSPEVLEGKPVTTATDIWAFAVIVYQFLTGCHCFHDESEYLMYKRIQKLLYSFPENFNLDAKDLIERILLIEPCQRLGTPEVGGPEALRAHSYFSTVDWKEVSSMESPLVIY